MAAPGTERTFAIIKPDAVANGKAEEIMGIIQSKGFKIIAKEQLRVGGRPGGGQEWEAHLRGGGLYIHLRHNTLSPAAPLERQTRAHAHTHTHTLTHTHTHARTH